MVRRIIVVMLCVIAVSCGTTSSFYGERRLTPTDIGKLMVFIDDQTDNSILGGNEFLQKSIIEEVCNALKEKGINAVSAYAVNLDKEAYSYSHALVLQSLRMTTSQGYHRSDSGGGTTYTINTVSVKAIIVQKSQDGSLSTLCESYAYGDGMNLLEKRFNMTSAGQLLGYEKNLDSVYRTMFLRAALDLFAKSVQTTSSEFINASTQFKDRSPEIANANTRNDTDWTPLMMAAFSGDCETVMALLDKGTGVNTKDNEEATALMAAAQEGHAEIVEALLSKGADVNMQSYDGRTALGLAAQWGHIKIVQILLSKGADANTKNNKGGTPLFGAAHEGHTEVVEVLLDKGAEVNAKTNEGATALFAAARNGHTETVEALLLRGADVNAKTNEGLTALMAGAVNGDKKVVKVLLASGADVNATAIDGWTSMALAREGGYAEIVQLLKQAGAKE